MLLEWRFERDAKDKQRRRTLYSTFFFPPIFGVGIVAALPVPTESQSEGLGRLPAESLINQKVWEREGEVMEVGPEELEEAMDFLRS
jgi:hypothetical protein